MRRRRPARSTSAAAVLRRRADRRARRPRPGTPASTCPTDEIELGVGIHGEPGRERRPMRTGRARSPTSRSSAIHDDMPLDRATSLVMVNGMGGTPLIELYVVFDEVAESLDGAGRHDRPHAGRQLRHQPGHGRRLDHVLPLTPDLTRLWDAPVETPALRWGRLRVGHGSVLLVDADRPRLDRRAAATSRARGPADPARRRDRRRRPRRQPVPRVRRRGDDAGRTGAGHPGRRAHARRPAR